MTIQLAKNQRGGEKGSPKPTVRERGRSQTSDGYVEFQPKKRYPVTVYNLDRQTCWQELKDFGRLAGGTVVFCQVDKINRGRGLIEYISQEDANQAVKELNGRVLHGKALSLYIHPDRRPYDHFKRVSPAKSPETQQRYEPYPSSRSRQSTVESSTSAGSRTRTKTNDQNLSPVKRVAVETHSPLRQRDCFPAIHAKDGYGDAYSRPQYHRDEYWEWDRRAGEEYHRAWDREYYC
ncbi:hypothetical protein QCA50_000110 [Cerrena zonata]|uniref:RRM domain-containing protein n=1 Tax=Cerrena zonata TaxID=2478898 RepID=A0AAW0GU35_9APHY